MRNLVFGPESGVEASLGYHVAAFEVDGYFPRDELVYVGHGLPGRQISRISMREDKTLFLFVFRDEYLDGANPASNAERKTALAGIFADVGWEGPRILAAMEGAGEIYFDSVSQIRMTRWHQGRVGLIGDAAACVSLLAGEGTGLAIAQAYVLAGELQAANADYSVAFARYEQRMMPFLRAKQESAAAFASSFAPRTALGLHFRNVVSRLLTVRPVADYFIGRGLRDDLNMPAYG